jgi:methionyl aminopeptidase
LVFVVLVGGVVFLAQSGVGGVFFGYNAFSAVRVIAGQGSTEKQALLDATRQSLEAGIARAVPGNRIGDISAAVEGHINPLGYGLVREYVGHGIGRKLHEPPQVPNYGKAGTGPLLKPGMVIAIEPMVNIGGWETAVLDDGWTVVTKDGTLSAHFEHSVAVTEDGPVVLTSP